jgi:hypothetical protein
MNLESIKEFLSTLTAHDLPAGAAALIGFVLVFLVFKTGKVFMKVMFLLFAAALFAGAYWWHYHK